MPNPGPAYFLPDAPDGVVWPPPRPKPIIYFVEPASVCNAVCVFCHYDQLVKAGKPVRVADDETMSRALALLSADARARGLRDIGVSLTPTTGEILAKRNWAEWARRLLELEFVGWLDIVTNAILLNEYHTDALLALPDLGKLNFSISVGGLDVESYRTIFGVDRFVRVRDNIRRLTARLAEADARLFLSIRLRVADGSTIARDDLERAFNPAGYRWIVYEVLDTFKSVPEAVPGTEFLKFEEELEERAHRPCGMLRVGSMNFAADGAISACGCHFAQTIGGSELDLGGNGEDLAFYSDIRADLNARWQADNIVPRPCQTCQHYHQHDGAEQTGILFRPDG